jgi:hypothetical protein
MYLRGLLDRCEETVRGHLVPDEIVLAVGRCEDITLQGSIDAGGAAWTFIMVTNLHVRWVPHCRPPFEASLAFEDVIASFERSRAHRYAISLRHAAIKRPHRVPAHRFLMFSWGNAVRIVRFTRTDFAFSRRDTTAARALRAMLASAQSERARGGDAPADDHHEDRSREP